MGDYNTGHGYDYDLLVIGSGPGGQRASIAAAKLGRRVAIVDRRAMIGGVCINTGTIPSKTLREAVISASHLRFRPILMTSFAFIMGVLPMAISTGAGANARHAIGTGVIGGMFFATFLGLLLIPVFFVSVRRMLGDRMDEPSKEYLEEQGKPASR